MLVNISLITAVSLPVNISNSIQILYICAMCENVLYVCDSMEEDYPNYKYNKYYVMLHGNILDIEARYLVFRP